MTRILLHGGYGREWAGAGDDAPLFQMLADAAAASDRRVLITFLALESPRHFPFLAKTIAAFQSIAPDIGLTIAGRGDDIGTLLADHAVVFFQGGNSLMQQEAFRSIDRRQLTENKELVAGSSSGAMMLCKWGYSHSAAAPVEGKGLLDLALMPHADTWPVKRFLPRLREATTLPVLLLAEGQSAVFDTPPSE